MNKISNEKKQQIIAVIIGSVVVVGCLWWFVIREQGKTLDDTRDKTKSTIDKITAAENLIKKDEQVKADMEQAKKKLDGIEGGMASGDLYSWVIETVDNFRKGPPPHKVGIRNYSHEEIVAAGILPDFPYKGAKYIVTGTAFYHDLGQFIAEFENAFPYFHIRNIDLAPTESTADEADKLTFRMEIVALAKPLPTPPK